jgi:hypothetical protein
LVEAPPQLLKSNEIALRFADQIGTKHRKTPTAPNGSANAQNPGLVLIVGFEESRLRFFRTAPLLEVHRVFKER